MIFMIKNGFCKFYKNLYWDDTIKNRNLVKWRLCHNRKQLTIFCVVRATNGIDQLEIIHNAFLSQDYYLCLTKSSARGTLWQFAHPRPLSLLQRGLAPRSKGKARVELRPARRQSRLPHSRSLLLPGRER